MQQLTGNYKCINKHIEVHQFNSKRTTQNLCPNKTRNSFKKKKNIVYQNYTFYKGIYRVQLDKGFERQVKFFATCVLPNHLTYEVNQFAYPQWYRPLGHWRDKFETLRASKSSAQARTASHNYIYSSNVHEPMFQRERTQKTHNYCLCSYRTFKPVFHGSFIFTASYFYVNLANYQPNTSSMHQGSNSRDRKNW